MLKSILFVKDKSKCQGQPTMKKKKKRGRPLGGKHPEEIRRYWREMKRKERERKKRLKKHGKKGK